MSYDPALIQSIPLEILQVSPGGVPPPGYQALSPHPETLRPQTIAVGCVFLVIATIFFAIRAYVKICINKKLVLDDYICTTAYLLSIIQFSGIMLAVTQGAGGRHMWDSTAAQLLSHPNVVANWITTVFVTPALGFAKLTFLIQYYMLFWPMRWVRVSCWIGGGLSMAFYVAITITMFVLCSPWPGENWIEGLLSHHFALAQQMSVPTGAVGAAIDIFLLVLPIRAVLSLQLPNRKKIALILVFLTGALASVASIVGLAYRVKNIQDAADAEWGVAHIWIWMQIELFAGIACSCMPSLSKLVFDRKSNGRSILTPRRILNYFIGSQRSKLAEERTKSTDSKDSKDSKPSPSTYTYDSQDSVTQSRPEMVDVQGNQSSTIRGGVSTAHLKKNSATDQHIHLVHEVSVYGEQSIPEGEVPSHEDVERGGIDRRW